MTIKEMLEKAIKAVIAQGAASVNEIGCAYRGKDGMKCAVGHLISDEYYKESLEGGGIQTPCVVVAVELSNSITLSSLDLSWLNTLQRAHDDNSVEQPYGGAFLNRFEFEVRHAVDTNMLPEYCLEWLEG